MPDTKSGKISADKVVITSFAVSILDIAINTVVAIISGSVTMLSQALQGFSDLIAAGFLIIGVKRAKRTADSKHPLGYGKELYFWTFLAALVTFTITASASFYFGLKRFLNPEPIENIWLAFLALSIAIVTNSYSMSLGLRRLLGGSAISKTIDVFTRSVHIETKKAFLLDIMGTTAPVLGMISLILYHITGELHFDGFGAMIIGISMGIFALVILKGAKDLLVGQSAPPEIENKIKSTVQSNPHVISVLGLQTLYLGTEKLLVNLEVHIKDRLETDDIEELIDILETNIKAEVPSAKHIQIELETPDV